MAEATFSRNSVAYNSDGSQVQANQPRFTAGKFGQGILVEEGTTNIISVPVNTSGFTNNPATINWDIANNFKISGTDGGGGTLSFLVVPQSYLSSSDIQNIAISFVNPIQIDRWVIQLYDSTNTPISSGNMPSEWTYNQYYKGWYKSGMSGITSLVIPLPPGVRKIGFGVRSAISSGGTLSSLERLSIEAKSYATSFTDGTRQPDLLQISSDILDVTKPFTIECYGQSNASGYRMIFDAWNRFYVSLTNNVVFAWTDENGIQKSVWSSLKVSNPNDMHYWTYVFDGNNHKVYVDGIKYIDTVAISMKPMPQYIRIGTWSAYPWNGIIDDFRISSIARSDYDIASAFSSNLPLPIDPYTMCKMNFDGNLAYNCYVKDIPLAYSKRYLRIYDRNHNMIDEINEFSNLNYTWTLNGMGKAEFNVGLESIKTIEENYRFRNHVEIWEDTTNRCVWGGQIVQVSFQGSRLHVGCYGYLSLLWKRRLRAKTYNEMSYGNLLKTLLNDVNAIYNTGVSLGVISPGSLLTQRKVENKDYALDKMQEYIQDCNNDFEVDNNRQLNFYLRKGTDKPHYTLQYGTDADNILLEPELSRSILESSNSVYSESSSDSITLTSIVQDDSSIALYGLMDGQYSASSGIVVQSTLDNYVAGELQRRSYPLDSITLSVKDSSLCPFNDIGVGDSVTVYLKPYWEYKQVLRILEMTHDENTGTRQIIVGQSIYRPQKPQVKLYRK